jgi:hypothetical protein
MKIPHRTAARAAATASEARRVTIDRPIRDHGRGALEPKGRRRLPAKTSRMAADTAVWRESLSRKVAGLGMSVDATQIAAPSAATLRTARTIPS